MAEAWRSAPMVGEGAGVVGQQPDVSDDVATPAWKSAPIVPLTPRGVLPKGADIGANPPQPEGALPDDAPWHSLVTGEGRTEFPEAPELRAGTADLSPAEGPYWRVLAGIMTSAEPAQIADIAEKALPGAKRFKDKHGNLMLRYRGKRFYVNKPGMSRTDLIQILAQTVAFLPAGRVATLPGTLGKRLLTAAPANTATSIGLDVGAEALGSEQGVDYTRAAITGAAGAAAEILSPLASKFMRAIRKSPDLLDQATGKLTERGRRMAASVGMDPDKMGEDLSRMFAEEASTATGTAGAVQRIRGKEFGVPLTRGQAGDDFNALAKEEATRHGAYGEKAGDIMRQFDTEQQTAMQHARGDIQAGLGGGETRLARPAQAGDVVGPGLTARAAAKKDAVDAAYETARETEARITAGGFRGLWRRAAEAVTDFGIDAQLHPAATRALRSLRKLESTTRRRAKGKARITSVALKRIETERRKLLNLERATANPADAEAVRRIKGEFDNWLDEAMDNALFVGDDQALAVMKKARAERRQYGALFEQQGKGDRAGKIIQSIVGEDRTPEQVMNLVMGRSKLGAQDVSVDVLKRIKKITGTDAEEWLVLKEAGWLKLAKEIGDGGFSPTKFKNRLNDVLETNRSWIDELYTPDEINLFERFRDEVMRTVTPAGARNPSKTAHTLARLAREWAGRIGTMLTFSGSPLGGATFFTMKRLPQVMGTRAAKKAVRPVMPPRARMPLFVSGAAAGSRLEAGDSLPPETP